MSSAPSPCDRQQVLGMPVDVCLDVLAAAVELHRNGGGQLVTLNSEMTMLALEQKELGQVIRAADLVIPDGAGVVGPCGAKAFGCAAALALSSLMICWPMPPNISGALPWWGRARL